MSRLGVRATPWNRGQVYTFLTNEVTEFGPRLFANVGLIQGFQLNERWVVDVGIDQANTLVDDDARIFDPDRELASGSLNEDFLAVYTGAMYSAEAWSANSRIEYRNSDTEERGSLLVGWYREPTVGHGLSASLTVLSSDSISGNELTSADLKIGWAYRMADSAWSFLNRTDFIYEDAVLASETSNSWRMINNFNANRRFSPAMQMSLQYAFKYVRSEFDGDGYTGYTDLVGVDLRRGIRSRWDVGVNTSVYHAYQSKVIDYGLGIDVGFNLRDNMWLTLGYNITGFDDSDFSQARYTAQGPYLRFSIKADQHTLKQIAGR
jgi:opacity protein-like surface antigen